MEWSPQAAMRAYLQTIHLYQHKEEETLKGSSKIIEPKSMELISALAAGKQAKLMVEISTQGITPFTIALAVAAKQTGGRLISIIIPENLKKIKTSQLKIHQQLKDVIKFVHGNPSQVILEYEKIDFLVVDGKLEDHLEVVKRVSVNPIGCIIAGHNLHYSCKNRVSFGQVLKEKKGVRIVTLPIGEGIELTRIESNDRCKGNTRRCKRFHVTFEN